MATAGGMVVLHPAGADGGDVQQLAVVGIVLIHLVAWQYTQVCDLLEFQGLGDSSLWLAV